MYNSTVNKIFDRAQLVKRIASWRVQECTVVFTNGCFDLIHLGHLDYLEKARQQGDYLVVGVNTDRSVRQLKGPSRPIKDEYTRARLLAALGFVDAVVLFDEETPLELIDLVQPDVLVKGADYEEGDIVGAAEVRANGGRVERIAFLEGHSTSALIDHIKSEGHEFED